MQPKNTPKHVESTTARAALADLKPNRAAGAVLKTLASGQTAAYVANVLGVSENLIYRWLMPIYFTNLNA